MTSARSPLSLAQTTREFQGSWVAVDRSTGEVKASASSSYVLSERIREEGLRGVAIVRVPGASEPELVGLG